MRCTLSDLYRVHVRHIKSKRKVMGHFVMFITNCLLLNPVLHISLSCVGGRKLKLPKRTEEKGRGIVSILFLFDLYMVTFKARPVELLNKI